MESILVFITILAPIITAVAQLVKPLVPDKYSALLPFGLGIIIGAAYFPLAGEGYTLYQLVWAGALSGLTAAGVYSVQNIRNK